MMLTLGMSEEFADPGSLGIIWGAKDIARALGLEPRQVRYMAERGRLPIGKVGNRLFARRERLLEHLEKLSQGGEA